MWVSAQGSMRKFRDRYSYMYSTPLIGNFWEDLQIITSLKYGGKTTNLFPTISEILDFVYNVRLRFHVKVIA